MLDILPTAEYWDMLSPRFGIAIYHWMFLAQPAPFPERLIGGESRYFCDHSLASWTKDDDLGAFDPVALDDYRAMFDDPARIAAMCADYRAGATYDLALDREDRARGRLIRPPLLDLYGQRGIDRRPTTATSGDAGPSTSPPRPCPAGTSSPRRTPPRRRPRAARLPDPLTVRRPRRDPESSEKCDPSVFTPPRSGHGSPPDRSAPTWRGRRRSTETSRCPPRLDRACAGSPVGDALRPEEPLSSLVVP